MGRALTTPVNKPDLAYQCVDGIRFEIPHLWDGSAVVMAKDSVYVKVDLTNYDETGAVMGRESVTLNFADWPVVFKSEANALYTMIENWLESQGVIEGSGTTEEI